MAIPEYVNGIKDGNTVVPICDSTARSSISGILDGTTIDSFADVESALSGKEDTLTFDDAPTASSTNPVKSGGVYSGIVANTQLIADTVGWIGKNKIIFPFGNRPISGFPWTDNGIEYSLDGQKIVANNTALANSSISIYRRTDGPTSLHLPVGKYILSGRPNVVNTKIRIGLYYTENNVYKRLLFIDSGTEAGFEITQAMLISGKTYCALGVDISIDEGVVADNLVFSLMIRDADDPDPTYEPYHESVDDCKADKVLVEDSIGWLSINLFNNTMTDHSKHSVTFTVADDKTVTLSGTSDDNVNVGDDDGTLGRISGLTVGEKYILKGAPAGSSATTYRLVIRNDSNTSEYYVDLGEGVEFIAKNVTYTVYIRVSSGVDVTGVVYKPMICKPVYAGYPYKPYHASVDECKLNISDLKTVTAASSDFADFQTRIAAL